MPPDYNSISGWRFRGKTKYYVSISGRKYFKPTAFSACRRDKVILRKAVDDLCGKDIDVQTIYSQYPMTDFRYYGISNQVILTYQNKFNIKGLLQWQSEALHVDSQRVLNGGNLVYCAPTGIGKSLVYEVLMLRRLLYWKGQCMIVLPYISLIEEKRVYMEELCEANGLFCECFYSNGSQRLDSHIDVAISTVEKANIIVNRCILEGERPRINLLIVDEAQMIEKERGYLLELLYIKLKSLNPSIQIVFLSATLPYPHALAKWLNASLFLYDEHYSQESCSNRIETIVVNGEIQTLAGETLSTLSSSDALSTLSILMQELFKESPLPSILLFCPTKHRCEYVAKLLFSIIPDVEKNAGLMIDNAILDYVNHNITPLDGFFQHLIRKGLSIHHAGLTDKEREIAEFLFRRGHVKLLIATSTLSAGVNLNVDVVIIDGVKRCQILYSPTEYKQMIGRTGRMGQEKPGRSYCIVDHRDREPFLAILQEGQSANRPTEEADATKSIYLRNKEYWKRAIIECIAIGLASTPYTIVSLLLVSSYYPSMCQKHPILPTEVVSISFHQESRNGKMMDILDAQINPIILQENDPFVIAVCSSLVELIRFHFIRILLPHQHDTTILSHPLNWDSNEGIQLIVTELGEAVFSSGLAVDEVWSVVQSLTALNSCIDITNTYQIMYHLTPLSLQVHYSLSVGLSYMERYLSEGELQFINHHLIPISVLYLLRGGARIESIALDHQIALPRLLSSFVVRDLLIYNNLNRTSQLFGLTKGTLQGIQVVCRVFYFMNLKIMKCLHYDMLYEVFKSFDSDVNADVSPEVLSLLNQGLELRDAIVLVGHGYLSIPAILNENPILITSLLMDKMPWQNAFYDESYEIENNDYDKCMQMLDRLKRNMSRSNR